jgi:ATP-dependent RNA helicase RhlE
MRFDELTAAEPLLRAVEELGWTVPTPIQAKAIPPARAGQDLVGLAQTGTGKTAAFLLPALEKQLGQDGLRTLVLCPTRELAEQVAEDARALLQHTDLWVGLVVGGVPLAPQVRDLRAGFDVLVATPGRLIDHLERGNVRLDEVEVLVLDEADRMLDMGFRPQIEAVLREMPRERQTLLFSATMPNGVHALALRILRDPVWVEVAPSMTAAENVEQVVYPVRQDRKTELLLELLAQEGMDQVLVFTRTKRGADLLSGQLAARGIQVSVMHGDRDMRQRRGALAEFAEGHVQVLVATDVAQRGLDIEGISHVINFDVPQDPEDYVHRIGRTARAGASGRAITLMSGGELALVHDIERALGYKLARVAAEGDEYAAPKEPVKPMRGRTSHRGGRMGSRKAAALSPEELRELMKVG